MNKQQWLEEDKNSIKGSRFVNKHFCFEWSDHAAVRGNGFTEFGKQLYTLRLHRNFISLFLFLNESKKYETECVML